VCIAVLFANSLIKTGAFSKVFAYIIGIVEYSGIFVETRQCEVMVHCYVMLIFDECYGLVGRVGTLYTIQSGVY